MEPMPWACHVQAGFILMDHFRLDQRLFDLPFHLGQSGGTPSGQFTEGAFTQVDSQQIVHHFTDSCQW